MTDLDQLVRLDDPQFWLDEPYPVFARLRAQAPVLYCDSINAFAITRYADVQSISRNPELFSSEAGIVLNDSRYGGVLRAFFPENSELISMSDPPRHRELRRVIAPSFTPRAIADKEPIIRRICRDLISTIPAGEEIDFVETVAVRLPLRVISHLLGLPEEDAHQLRVWTDEMLTVGSALTADELSANVSGLAPLHEYILATFDAKRRQPLDDLISHLVQAEVENEKLTDMNILALSMAALIAGNGTTRNLSGSVVAMLGMHGAERERLAAEPTLAAQAVDETLRYRGPVLGFLRTATDDTKLHGQPIAKGERVFMVYASANRDETIFEDPDVFRITRVQTPSHLAFGYGEHVCPGASLARMEGRVLLEELVDRFSGWELTSEPIRLESIHAAGFSHIPVTFGAR